jgi:hypothetical protein
MVQVLGEIFSIEDGKLGTQGIRYTNITHKKKLEYIISLVSHPLKYSDLISRK